MLETIRVFVAERLAARPDAAEIQRRHADYYRRLTEQADRPLRGAGQNEWLERLQAEAGNLAAAVRWYLAHDPGSLPHLFRILWPFWFLRDHMREGQSWTAQLLAAADPLDPQARAELVGTALGAALEVGDDEAALAADALLKPLLAGIDDPFFARDIPAGHGVVRADHRRFRRCLAGGGREPGAASRPGRAVLDGAGRRLARHRGEDPRP
jgi:hypothetical protein